MAFKIILALAFVCAAQAASLHPDTFWRNQRGDNQDFFGKNLFGNQQRGRGVGSSFNPLSNGLWPNSGNGNILSSIGKLPFEIFNMGIGHLGKTVGSITGSRNPNRNPNVKNPFQQSSDDKIVTVVGTIGKEPAVEHSSAAIDVPKGHPTPAVVKEDTVTVVGTIGKEPAVEHSSAAIDVPKGHPTPAVVKEDTVTVVETIGEEPAVEHDSAAIDVPEKDEDFITSAGI